MSDTLTLEPTTVRHERVHAKPARVPFMVRLAPAFAARFGEGDAARRKRREMPIRCYVGPNASGKTMFCVRDILPSLDAGRLVFSTVPLLDWNTGELHENYRLFNNWQQLFDNPGADFVADEISAIAASRDHNNLHSDVINHAHQLRKTDQTFSWTAPAWRRADLSLREVTWVVTECRGFLPDRVAAEAEDRLWASRRLFRANTYNMREFDEWSAGKRESVKPDAREWFYGVNSREFASYDTLAAVDRIAGYDPKACTHCGRPKRTQYCAGNH